MKKAILAGAILFTSTSSFAAALGCYSADDGTNKTYCVEEKGIKQNGDVRAGTLYTGGPKNVRPTPYTLMVNCKTMISTVQDSDGVNFGGGTLDSIPSHTRALVKDMCANKSTKLDKTLKQF